MKLTTTILLPFVIAGMLLSEGHAYQKPSPNQEVEGTWVGIPQISVPAGVPKKATATFEKLFAAMKGTVFSMQLNPGGKGTLRIRDVSKALSGTNAIRWKVVKANKTQIFVSVNGKDVRETIEISRGLNPRFRLKGKKVPEFVNITLKKLSKDGERAMRQLIGKWTVRFKPNPVWLAKQPKNAQPFIKAQFAKLAGSVTYKNDFTFEARNNSIGRYYGIWSLKEFDPKTRILTLHVAQVFMRQILKKPGMPPSILTARFKVDSAKSMTDAPPTGKKLPSKIKSFFSKK